MLLQSIRWKYSRRIAALLDDDTYAVRAKACFLLGKVNATNQAAWSLALQNAMNLRIIPRDRGKSASSADYSSD